MFFNRTPYIIMYTQPLLLRQFYQLKYDGELLHFSHYHNIAYCVVWSLHYFLHSFLFLISFLHRSTPILLRYSSGWFFHLFMGLPLCLPSLVVHCVIVLIAASSYLQFTFPKFFDDSVYFFLIFLTSLRYVLWTFSNPFISSINCVIISISSSISTLQIINLCICRLLLASLLIRLCCSFYRVVLCNNPFGSQEISSDLSHC